MRLFKYRISPKPNAFAPTPVGGHFAVGRDAITASVGIRGWYGLCLILPLETESQWQRRHQKRHEAMVARMLP